MSKMDNNKAREEEQFLILGGDKFDTQNVAGTLPQKSVSCS